MAKLFENRSDAGRRLAGHLEAFQFRDPVVLALPRGGVPVAYEVASRIHAPLDIYPVRKLGVPGHEELAFGALGPSDHVVLDDDVVRAAQISQEEIQSVIDMERRELLRRLRLYRGDRPALDLSGHTVIVVDDGLATGSTMRAAIKSLSRERPAHTVVAVPVAPIETCEAMRGLVGDAFCLTTPEPFHAVGQWYADFRQVSDEEVCQILEKARDEWRATG